MNMSYFDEIKNAFDYRTLNAGFLVAVGVTLGTVASFVCCLGINLQKWSLCLPENEHIPPYQQPKWVAGFAFVISGTILDFMAFGLAPASLLAPLAALSLVWNLGMASYFHDEKYNRIDVIAVALIFAGTGITVIFASHEAKTYTLAQLMKLYCETRMYFYSFVIPAFIILHYFLISYGSKMEILEGATKKSKLFCILGFGGFAGVMGGQSVLFAKSVIELLKDAAHGDDVFFHYETYMLIFLLVGCLLTQISFLNGALKRFDSLYVMPVYQSYWIISGVVGGLVYFGEWEDVDATQTRWFLFGIFVTFVGLFVLTQKEDHSVIDKPRMSIQLSNYYSGNDMDLGTYDASEEEDEENKLVHDKDGEFGLSNDEEED